MATQVRRSGLRVTVPEELRAEAEVEAPRSRGMRRLPTGPVAIASPASPAEPPPGGETAALLEALRLDDLQPLDTVDLSPVPGAPARRGPGAAPGEATLELDLQPGEGAVVLVEQEGLYSWQFPSAKAAPTATRAAAAGSTAVFRIPLTRGSPQATRRRGPVADFLIGRARAFVFRFVANWAAARATQFLERSVQPGIVLLDEGDPRAWKRVDTLAEVALPDTPSPRLLLFVHGTFSSTRGGFGGLAATPWGRDFLRAARSNYDAVVGFDHPTLSVDPEANAADLLRRLQGRSWPAPPRIDIICHSRGGITVRSLVERLLPAVAEAPSIERVVFAGAVNNGTLLAQPENWHALIDLYTNLAAGACRAASLFPQATFAAELLKELVCGIGGFAKALASEVVDRDAIPGLAAMEPDGPFIRRLNQTQPGQPVPSACRWYALTSEFEPSLAALQPRDLPRSFLLTLADGLMDQLMKEANDLVVNTASMTAIDAATSGFIKDCLAFGRNGVVYHTNYFLQPAAVNALARWLELQPESPPVAAGTRRGGSHPQATLPGSVARPVPPASIDTDILLRPASETGENVRADIEALAPSYVVLERLHEGRVLRYAFTAEETLAAARANPDIPLLLSLNLHEFQASPQGSVTTPPHPDPSSHFPTTRRGVAMDHDRVAGVVDPTQVEPRPIDALVALANQSLAPAAVEDDIARRRALPTLGSGLPHRAMRSAPSLTAMPMAAPTPAMPASPPPTRRGGRPRPAGSEPPPQAESAPPEAGSPPPTAAPGEASPVATCQFRAEMDDEIRLGATASVDVTVSREVLEQAARTVAAHASAGVRIDRVLTLELIPRLGVQALDPRRFDIPPPAPGQPVTRCFDIQATTAGDGEVWVRARQDGVPLVTLELRFRIVDRPVTSVTRTVQPATVSEVTGVSAPAHQLTIFERRDGDRLSYQFILDSPALNWKHVFESAPFQGDRQAYIDKRYAEIEQRWIESAEDQALFQEELRALGGRLLDELFPVDLQRLLWERRDAVTGILVYSEEPFIPWEMVHLKEPGRPLGAERRFLAQLGLVRWLHRRDADGQGGYPPTRIRLRPGRCRYVIPEYPDPTWELPEAVEERTFLETALGATPVEPQPVPVRQLLAGPGALDLFHFAGHGEAESANISGARLLLQGRVDANRQWIPASLGEGTVAQFASLADGEGNRPIVTLNACQAGRAGYHLTGIGGFARAFLGAGAGLFVGSSWAVGDAPARTFSETLYKGLLRGDTLAEATRAGREASRAAGDATWLAYTVYGHPDARIQRG